MNHLCRLLMLCVCAATANYSSGQVFSRPGAKAQDSDARTASLLDAANKAKQIALDQYRAGKYLNDEGLRELSKLPPDRFLERIAVQPPAGPSTIAAPAPKKRGVPTVNSSKDGGSTTGDAAVAMLMAYDVDTGTYIPWCTGTLVSQNVVLTAAHCVCFSEVQTDNYPNGALCNGEAPALAPAPRTDPRNWRVFFQHVGVKEVKTVITDNQYRLDDDGVRHDLALLVLKEPVREIGPAPLPAAAATLSWSSGVLIGFGYSSIGPDGQILSRTILEALTRPGLKSRGNVVATRCDDFTYVDANSALCSNYAPAGGGSTSTVCKGDSGGPLHDPAGMTIGVTSGRSDTENCTSDDTLTYQMATSYTNHQSWIANQLSTVGIPTVKPRWPPFGENLIGIVDRRNVGLFGPNGKYFSDGWLKEGGGQKVLATINSSGPIQRFEVQTRQGKVLCRGKAREIWRVNQVDQCIAIIPVGAEYRIVATGQPAQLLQYALMFQ